ncbi:MAG: DUF4279 domain-containing protein [Pseudomonadota bacterium]
MARIRTSTKRKLKRIRKRHVLVSSRKFQNVTSRLFWFDASIRIGGAGKFHDEIFERTGLSPNKSHLAGDRVSASSSNVRKEDIWILSSPFKDNEPIDQHLDWLLHAVAPHVEYLSDVVQNASWADLCLGCLSDVSYPLIATGSSATELVKRLNLELSFNFTCR